MPFAHSSRHTVDWHQTFNINLYSITLHRCNWRRSGWRTRRCDGWTTTRWTIAAIARWSSRWPSGSSTVATAARYIVISAWARRCWRPAKRRHESATCATPCWTVSRLRSSRPKFPRCSRECVPTKLSIHLYSVVIPNSYKVLHLSLPCDTELFRYLWN